MGKLLMALMGVIVAVLTWALIRTNPADLVLFGLGGLFVALSIPLLLMVGFFKSLLLRSVSFTSPSWRAYDTTSAERELELGQLRFPGRFFRFMFVLLSRAAVGAMVVGWVMLGAVYLLRVT
jgi:hypothetical protein